MGFLLRQTESHKEDTEELMSPRIEAPMGGDDPQLYPVWVGFGPSPDPVYRYNCPHGWNNPTMKIWELKLTSKTFKKAMKAKETDIRRTLEEEDVGTEFKKDVTGNVEQIDIWSINNQKAKRIHRNLQEIHMKIVKMEEEQKAEITQACRNIKSKFSRKIKPMMNTAIQGLLNDKEEEEFVPLLSFLSITWQY